MPTSHTATIRVDFTGLDRWGVAHSGKPADVATFSSMTAARRAGHHIAARKQPSELIVCNAYHDVIEIRSFPLSHGERLGPEIAVGDRLSVTRDLAGNRNGRAEVGAAEL